MSIKLFFAAMMVILVLPLVIAENDKWYFNSEILDIDLNISTRLQIMDKDYSLDSLNVIIANYPKTNYRQQVLTLDTFPEAKISPDNIIFEFKDPKGSSFDVKVVSSIQTMNAIQKIRQKNAFPIGDLPDNVKVYLEPTQKIDSDNPNIVKTALSLAEGEDDLFRLVNKAAIWTKGYVRYDLSTQNVQASIPASIVLKNKEGVCDEMTNLFIALMRSLGIPAKFVTGISYTTAVSSGDGFGAHGWAEVYFPEVGWVPVDVTYGQFSYVDPTHIKLSEGLDSDSSSTRYEWHGSQRINLKTNHLEFKTFVKKKQGKIEPLLNINVKTLKQNTALDSYNLVQANIKNMKDYYITPTLVLGKVGSLEILDDDEKHLVLTPNEEKTVFWRVKFNAESQANIIYDIPIIVYSYSGEEAKTSYSATSDEKFYALKEMQQVIDEYEQQQSRSYSRKVDLRCTQDKQEVYDYEEVEINCTVKNTGNTVIIGLNMCMDDSDCSTINLNIDSSKDFSYTVSATDIKEDKVTVKAENLDISKSIYVGVVVIGTPEISLEGLVYPSSVPYASPYSVNFTLVKKTAAEPKDVRINITHGNYYKQVSIDSLSNDREFVIEMDSKELYLDNNEFTIDITYSDDNGKLYKLDDNFTIELTDVNFFTGIYLRMRGFGEWVASSFV